MSSRRLERFLRVLAARETVDRQRLEAAMRAVASIEQQQQQLESLKQEYANAERRFSGVPVMLQRHRRLWQQLDQGGDALLAQRKRAETARENVQAELLRAKRRRDALAELAAAEARREAKALRRRLARRTLEQWLLQQRDNPKF